MMQPCSQDNDNYGTFASPHASIVLFSKLNLPIQKCPTQLVYNVFMFKSPA
jgi:hypothetical protein